MPYSIIVTAGDNQTTTPNTTFFQPVTVRVLDPQGVPVSGATVTFTVPPMVPGFAGATFPGLLFSNTTTTNVFGFATSPRLNADSPLGRFAVTASFSVLSTKANLLVIAPGGFVAPTVVPDYLSYSMVIGDKAPPLQTLTISGGSESFAAVADSPWIKITQRGQFLLDVAVDPTGMAAGRYEGRITFNQSTFVRVFFTIQPKPLLNTSAASMTFQYTQYGTTLPLIQPFQVGASVRNSPIQVGVTYTNPATGNWLGVASMVGMVTPAQLKAVVDPRGLNPGTYLASIQITGDAANSPLTIPVTLVVAAYRPPQRQPEITSFANAANLQDGAIAAGGMIRLAGANLSCGQPAAVLVDGDPAQILSAGGSEIRLVVPDSVSGKDRVPVVVACGNTSSDPFSVPVQYAAPALFTRNSTQALAFNEDDGLNGNDTPASRGGTVTIYGTGFGALDMPAPDGSTVFLAPLSVSIGGQAAEVVSASRSNDMPGVVRVKVRIPRDIPVVGAADLQVQTGLEFARATVVVN